MKKRMLRPGLFTAIILALMVGYYFHWIPPYVALALVVAAGIVNVATRGRPRPAGSRPEGRRDQGQS